MNMSKTKGILVIGMFLLLTMPFAMAIEPDHIISNSEDWKDVYSTIHYATLLNLESDFLTSTNHGKLLLSGINKNKEIQVISSTEAPYVFNYPSLILANSFKDAEEIEVKNANLELIDELPNINNFIVVGDSYGYNAIAVIPYATQTDSWIFLTNSLNVDQIDSILSQRNIQKLIIYGYVDREVRDTLAKYNPETINKGDKFQDNIEITKRFLDKKPTKQIILTNGDFIEKEIMMGNNPLLFTGRENVPDQIRDYLKNSEIEIGVLIGNELMGAATNIRRSTGISVMVKFARGARTANDGVSAVEGLDLFPLPTPSLVIGIDSIKYNKITGKLEITYKSEANVPIYLRGTIELKVGDETIRVGDTESIFLTPGNYKTLTYDVEITSNQDIRASIYTLFGETESSMDRILEADLDVSSVDILDSCEIEIKKVKYNKQDKEFLIYVDNLADVDCWVNIELKDIQIGYEKLTLGTKSPFLILKGDTGKIIIKQELTEDDLLNNPFVNLIANYGERENSLVKTITGKQELMIESFTLTTYAIIGTTIIMIILIFLFFKRRKEEEDSY